ncbi:MAG: hypothetical protein ABH865_05025 [Candidatus Omnitrophota bacterium]
MFTLAMVFFLAIGNFCAHARTIREDKIDGIIYSEKNPIVMIGGSKYTINETIGNWTIAKITPSSIIVKSQDVEREYAVGDVVKIKIFENRNESEQPKVRSEEKESQQQEIQYIRCTIQSDSILSFCSYFLGSCPGNTLRRQKEANALWGLFSRHKGSCCCPLSCGTGHFRSSIRPSI